MDAISYMLRAFFGELREASVSVFLLTQGHKVANYKAMKGMEQWAEEDGDFSFNPETMEVEFLD
jgi:hypothetical protein